MRNDLEIDYELLKIAHLERQVTSKAISKQVCTQDYIYRVEIDNQTNIIEWLKITTNKKGYLTLSLYRHLLSKLLHISFGKN